MALMAAPILYIASFGPVCWISSRVGFEVPVMYLPMGYATARYQIAYDVLVPYAQFGIRNGGAASTPILIDDWGNVIRADIRPATPSPQ